MDWDAFTFRIIENGAQMCLNVILSLWCPNTLLDPRSLVFLIILFPCVQQQIHSYISTCTSFLGLSYLIPLWLFTYRDCSHPVVGQSCNSGLYRSLGGFSRVLCLHWLWTCISEQNIHITEQKKKTTEKNSFK